MGESGKTTSSGRGDGPGLVWQMRVDMTRYPFTRNILIGLIGMLFLVVGGMYAIIVLASEANPKMAVILGAVFAGVLVLVVALVLPSARNAHQQYRIDERGIGVTVLRKNPKRSEAVGTVLRLVGGLASSGSAKAAGDMMRDPSSYQRHMPWEQVRKVVIYGEHLAISMHRGFSFVAVAVFCPDSEVFDDAVEMVERYAQDGTRFVERD